MGGMMRMKILTTVLLCLMILPAAAQDTKFIRESGGVKAILDLEDPEPFGSIQATKNERSKVIILETWVDSDSPEWGSLIKLSESTYVDFLITFTSLSATNTRFHLIWNGPETYSHTTKWYSAKYRRINDVLLTFNTNWKKGIYRLCVFAEPAGGGGGLGSKYETIVWFY